MIQIKFIHLFLTGVITGLLGVILTFVTIALDVSGAGSVTVRNSLFYSAILMGSAFTCLIIPLVAVLRKKVI